MAGLRSERLSFLYMHLLVALITLVVFQSWAASPIFIAHGAVFGQRQNCPVATKLDLKRDFQRRTGGVNNDFDTQLKIWLAWYGLTSTDWWFAVRVFALGRAGCVIML